MSKTLESRRVGRVAALVLLGAAIAYGIGGVTIDYAFSSDPLGPRVFPVMLAVVLAGLSLFYLMRPDAVEALPTGRALLRLLAIPALLVLSVSLFEPIGFAGAIFVLTFGAALIFGAPLRYALIGAVAQTLLWWLTFAYLLQVYLPTGSLFG